MKAAIKLPPHTIEKDWITEAGLRAVVIRSGYRCGYVGVPEGHPAWGKGYSEQIPQITQRDVDEAGAGKKSPLLILTATVRGDGEGLIRRSLDILIDVHGGITYSTEEKGDDYPTPSNNLWWFGFDCGHYGDDEEWGQSLSYCISECESMASQLASLAEKAAP